jgi:Sep-tRNA:Cys-tRNA synthetase
MAKNIELKRSHKDFINIMPLQTGGILTEAAKEALVEFGDGYSVCDFCNGELCRITNPPIADFVSKSLPEFLGSDIATITYGARDAKYMVMHSLLKPGDTIIVDGNRHYSTIVAAERAGLNIVEVPSSGHPEFRIDANEYEPLIEQYQPGLLLLTYPDGNYGNLADARRLSEIAKAHDVPYLINGAYSVGRMPVKMNELGADFIVGSGHKSMASAGPSGVLGMSKKWENTVLRKSVKYPKKDIELIGCSLRGTVIATLIASFPDVKERVKHWDEQVQKAQWFSGELEKLGFQQLGEKPHRHDLMHFESPAFFEISQHLRERGYFLYKELKDRKIWGLQPGLTKHFKVSTFAASRDELAFVIGSFKEIIQKYS